MLWYSLDSMFSIIYQPSCSHWKLFNYPLCQSVVTILLLVPVDADVDVVCLFQFGLFKIIGHEEALTIVARAMDPSDPSSMLEAVRLLAPICLVPPEGLVVTYTRP